MMKEMDLYKLWKEKATEDPDLVKELIEIEDKPVEIKNRFYADLEFGTAGLRGVLGAGTYCMNIYTVRRATQGLADYINEKYDNACAAIGYDSRNKSYLFAKEAASVLAANNIKVYIFPELEPTPLLSFAVRHLKAKTGIVITASHNPAKYNGYKCYGEDGCQMTSEAAGAVYNKLESVDYFVGPKTIDFDEGLKTGMINWIGEDLLEEYYKNVMAQSINPDIIAKAGLRLVYSPLNGAGNKPVRTVLSRCGIKDIFVVKEQENPDGNFPTTPFPNPEKRQCFDLAIKLAETTKPDLLLATDPDSDRVGIAVNQGGEYILMTGNEVGALLCNYIFSQRTQLGTMPKDPIAVKTIVTTNIVDPICKEYGVQLKLVLTGFKYIGEQILLLEQKGEENRYVFGFEESYGYLAGTYVRDKDAVVASMLIVEMASYYKSQGKTLYDVMQELYAKYGYYLNCVSEIVREGADGMAQLAAIMKKLRSETPSEIGGYKVTALADYDTSVYTDLETGTTKEIFLPKSNVLSYSLEGGNALIVRPSGTEPKIKIYCTAKGKDKADAQAIADKLMGWADKAL